VQYIVTNAHVVQNAYEAFKGFGEGRVYFSLAENDYVNPNIVFYSPPEDKDIAILKLPSPTVKRSALVLRPSNTAQIGETTYALGYPSVSTTLQSYITYDENDVTITRGIISKRSAIAGVTFEAFQIDTAINRGNSGGPLVDERGFVLGVNTLANMIWLDNNTAITQDANYASVADHTIRILREEGIPYSLKGENDWMLYAFAPLGILLLVIAIVLFATSGKAKPAAAAAGAAGGAAAAAGAVPNKRPVLRGVSGKYAGQKFELRSRLTIGRDSAQCNIVFPEGTPGVSANHCSVYYDANADCFMLTDNGSSYGTFLGNGRKRTATGPEKLYVGDTVYLADTAIRFVVSTE
jgi:hypothetical protein